MKDSENITNKKSRITSMLNTFQLPNQDIYNSTRLTKRSGKLIYITTRSGNVDEVSIPAIANWNMLNMLKFVLPATRFSLLYEMPNRLKPTYPISVRRKGYVE